MPHEKLTSTPRAEMSITGDVRSRMARDIGEIAKNRGIVTESDLLDCGWTRAQVTLHSAAALTLAGPLPVVDQPFNKILHGGASSPAAGETPSGQDVTVTSPGHSGGGGTWPEGAITFLRAAQLSNNRIGHASADLAAAFKFKDPIDRIKALSEQIRDEALALAALNGLTARVIAEHEARR